MTMRHHEPCFCGSDECPSCYPGRAVRHYPLGSLSAEDIDILHEQAAADEEAELTSQRLCDEDTRWNEIAAADADAAAADEDPDEAEARDTDIF